MSGAWRPFATTAATLVAVAGVAVLVAGAGPAPLIVGIIALVAVLVERTYRAPSRRAPPGANWRATDERFTDPETGLATRVWYDETSGKRHYVAERPGTPQ